MNVQYLIKKFATETRGKFMYTLLSFVHLRKTMRLRQGQSSEHNHPASKGGERIAQYLKKMDAKENLP